MLNDFLVHRREAIRLKNVGGYWYALDQLKTILSGTPLSEDNYVKADEIIKEIDEIELSSHNLKDSYHEGIRSLGHFQKNYRDNIAKKQFNSILRRITQILQAEGYFDILLGNQRNPITPISTLEAVTSKPSNEALPERLKEDME